MAGEEIDATLGVKLGFSTLASAGLGNLVSDVAGIGFAEQLEASRPLHTETCIMPVQPVKPVHVVMMHCMDTLKCKA